MISGLTRKYIIEFNTEIQNYVGGKEVISEMYVAQRADCSSAP